MLRPRLLPSEASSPLGRLLTPSISRAIPSRLLTTAPGTQPAAAPPSPPSLPYLVSRSPSQELPIYHVTKRGGNYKLTFLKKVEGDRRALKEAIMKGLSLENDKIRINPTTNHIEIRGYVKPLLARFLENQGF